MTTRGPQRNEPVDVMRGDAVLAAATCFFATFEDGGVERWRGFLASIGPTGAVQTGEYSLRFASGEGATISVREVRTEPREQAVFVGVGTPPRAATG